MRLFWFTGFFLLSVLAGCMAERDVLVSRDTWTGTTRITVPEREIFRGADGLVVTRPIVVFNEGGRKFAILTNVRRRDANGPRIERMTSGTTQLRYVRSDRLLSHCLDGCQPAEAGAIHLDEATFRQAARTGFPLRIWGLRGRYDGIVPAEAFAKVLAQIDATT